MKFNLGHWLLTISLEKFEGLIGINTFFNDKLQVGFMDLDKKTLEESQKIIIDSQKKYNLNDALLIQSSKGNYHAVFFDLKSFMAWLKINMPVNLEHCGYSVFRGLFVLRISKKQGRDLKFIKIIKSDYGKENKLSLNHINFFEKHFDINLSELKNNAIKNDEGMVLIECYNARVKKI